jgi:hypothetical protein
MTKVGREAQAGTALYTKFFLSLYDWNALKFISRFIWKCPSQYMLNLYNRYVSANHLDVGVGTGYFLDHCRFPVTNPRIGLMDLNPNCIEVTAKRLKRYNLEIYRWNVLKPFQRDVELFDSIGMMNLLHCLPGSMDTKSVVFEHMKYLLNPGGVMFGSTLLGTGVPRNFLAMLLLKYCNFQGYMSNCEDDPKGLEFNLNLHFSEVALEIIGCMALFSARKPNNSSQTDRLELPLRHLK